MKTRMIVAMLIVALAVWLPLTAQQTTAPQTNAPQAQDKNACACCEFMKDQSKEASKGMTCCQGKDSCCCKRDKDSKDSQSAMNCCGNKDGMQCAKDGMQCCGKDAKKGYCHHAMAANPKEGTNCCAGHGCCAHGVSQS
jgi:hypothetical protein